MKDPLEVDSHEEVESFYDIASEINNNYLRFRGKCKELSEEAIRNDQSLTLIKGYYICPFWGKQQHWWTRRQDGSVFDPTKNQFPSKGSGEYIEFDGMIECEHCGNVM